MVTTRKQVVLERVGRAAFVALAWALTLAMVAASPARAQTFKTLYKVTEQDAGSGPNSPLIWDSAGNLYGTVGSSPNGQGGTVRYSS